ncbi:hypothetical protein, partial [Vibrio lentus]|uniref:hypothetical protein n=1 Tax=Vibrio lentus TaxID=136468 RepID=UPI001A7E145E
MVTHRLTSPSNSPFDEHHRSQTNGVQGGEPKARLVAGLITLTCFKALQDSIIRISKLPFPTFRIPPTRYPNL